MTMLRSLLATWETWSAHNVMTRALGHAPAEPSTASALDALRDSVELVELLTGLGLRERTRRAVTAELTAVAMDLFLSQGYEATTVEQIAEAGGLSRRSFFRYFAGKDDVLRQALAVTGAGLVSALSARPPDEAPWTALRRCFDGLIDQTADDARALAMTRAMLDSPALRAAHLHKQSDWQRGLAEVLVDRLPPDLGARQRRVHAVALAGAALSCFEAAQAEWAASGGELSMHQLLDDATGAIVRSVPHGHQQVLDRR